MSDEIIILSEEESASTSQDSSEDTSLLGSGTAGSPSTQNHLTPRRRAVLLAIICFLRVGMGMSYSLLSAFYGPETYWWKPRHEASRYSGIVTGAASPFLLLGAIFTGQVGLHQISSKSLVCLGLLLLSGSTLLFGYVGDMAEWTDFFAFSILLRMTTGLGQGIVDVASFAIGTTTFPDHPGLTSGFLEQSWAIGIALGAPFGGWMRELGGFGLPFYALAGIQALQLLISSCCVQSLKKDIPGFKKSDSDREKLHPKSILDILKVWVVMTGICGFLSVLLLGYPQGALAPFAESQLSLKPGGTGLLLLVSSICYVIMTPVAGKLAEWLEPRWLLVIGLYIGAGGMVLMGIGDNLTKQITAQVLLGMGLGISLTSTFVILLLEARRMGYEMCEKTNGVVYTVATIALSLGEMTGSAAGGPLAAEFGFFTISVAFAAMIGGFSIIYLTMAITAYCPGTFDP